MKYIQIITIFILISTSWTTDQNWWKHATIYEVFLKSFKDSNGDGIGDLKGVISKLDYFVDIGVDTVWITPFYPSSGMDSGYDITNFYGIDSTYGTMEDFEELMREMKIRGLNFVMDLVINHSSDEHEWFQKSIKRVEPYTDYYIWRDPKWYDQDGHPVPPNRWTSIFNTRTLGSCWSWNDERKQFYFHHFGVKQPDFNLRNENVKRELKALMKFWLDKGVTAFRIDAVSFFMEDPQLGEDLDEHGNFKSGAVAINNPDNYPFLNELYLYVKQYDRENRKQLETAIIAETYGPIDIVMKYFGTPSTPVAHFPFNFRITDISSYMDAPYIIGYLNVWLDNLPEGATNNWALGNHDRGRIFERLNKEYNYIFLTMVTMLPGTCVIYYGEELSQELFDLNPNSQKDLFVERDQFRTPMQWDDSLNAGFTSATKSWLPVHPGYIYSNVETQKAQKNSPLNYFKNLTSIRKTKIAKFGDLKLYPISRQILAIIRIYHGNGYVVLLNLGAENDLVNLRPALGDLPPTMKVIAASPNSEYKIGDNFFTALSGRHFSLMRPHSAVVLAFEDEHIPFGFLEHIGKFEG